MKKILRYIFLLSIAVILSFNNKKIIKAVDDVGYFTCDYGDITLNNKFTLPSVTVRYYYQKVSNGYQGLRLVIETNGKTLPPDGSMSIQNILGDSNLNNGESLFFSYNSNNALKAVDFNSVECPIISTLTSTSSKLNKFQSLTFSSTKDTNNTTNYDQHYAIKEPEVVGDMFENIEGESGNVTTVKETKSCDYYYEADKINGLTEPLRFRLVMMSNGEKRICVANHKGVNAIESCETYSNNTTEFELQNSSSKKFWLEVPAGEADLIYKNSSNNSFTCPDKKDLYVAFWTDDVYVLTADEEKLDQYRGGSEAVNPTEDSTEWDKFGNSSYQQEAYYGLGGSCTDILSTEMIELLDGIYDVIKYGSIVILVVLAMLDISKSVITDKNELGPIVKKFVTRLIFLILLLLIPTIIEVLGSLAGHPGILCGIK